MKDSHSRNWQKKRLTLVSTPSIAHRAALSWLSRTDGNSLCYSKRSYPNNSWRGRAELGELVEQKYLELDHCLDWPCWWRSAGQDWYCLQLGLEGKLGTHGRTRWKLRWWFRRVTNAKRGSAMSRWRAASHSAVMAKKHCKRNKKIDKGLAKLEGGKKFKRRLRYIQSLLVAGAVWLSLGPPHQPEGCRGGSRCSQTAPATRRDCVYHHGTETRLEQVNLEKRELEKKLLDWKKRQKPSLRLQPCEIVNISPRAEICNIAWPESADSVLAEQVPVQGQGYMWGRRILQRSSVDLIGLCHGYRRVTYDIRYSNMDQTEDDQKSTASRAHSLVREPLASHTLSIGRMVSIDQESFATPQVVTERGHKC